MLKINVSSNAQKFVAEIDATKREVRRAAIVALNRTADGVRAAATRLIRAQVKVAAGEVRRSFKITRAHNGRLQAVVSVTGRRLNILAFGAKQTKKGVTANIFGKRELFEHAFIAQMKTGYLGVFRRKGKPRLPIDQVLTVSLPTLFKRQIITGEIEKEARARFEREFEAASRQFIKP